MESTFTYNLGSTRSYCISATRIGNATLIVDFGQWLLEWLLPTPEVYGRNPVISKINAEHLFTVNCMEKTKIKKK